MSVHTMAADRALEIHGRLVEAWMVREGIRLGPTPSLRGIRLADAVAAVGMIAGGGASATARLDALSVSHLFAWTIVQGQMS